VYGRGETSPGGNSSSPHVGRKKWNEVHFQCICACNFTMCKKRYHFFLAISSFRTQFNFSRKLSPRTPPKTSADKSKTTLTYLVAFALATVGVSYATVPLYRLYCQQSGYGGTVNEDIDEQKVRKMRPAKDRRIEIHFNADTAATMRWNFRPQQPVVVVSPGETALAFYTAKNPTDKAIDGISTYNVVPFEAGPYFNKIQCFCFEEQRLNPHEEVDMPVFFYIDPDYAEDPGLEGVDTITLSYTFFESKPGMKLPMPFENVKKFEKT
jgi:cytochrome c oxidase assembly protein subunit 11